MTDSSALLGGLDGAALGARLRTLELGCVELACAFLDACDRDQFSAWAATDPDGLLTQARELDRLGAAEREQLPLFGLPVAVKDNFDTADLPTAYGSPIYSGSRPAADSAAVQRLRAAGAMIAGKTKCAEFAWMFPCDTLNPLASERTPGGSSSGSAAAVAAGTSPWQRAPRLRARSTVLPRTAAWSGSSPASACCRARV